MGHIVMVMQHAARRSGAPNRRILRLRVHPTALSGMFSRRTGACRAVRYLPFSPATVPRVSYLRTVAGQLDKWTPMACDHPIRGSVILMVKQKRQSHVVAVLARGQI